MGALGTYIFEEELKTHNKKGDLWISIHGKVYNVSDWVDHHPGGALPLIYFAGQDVTNVFLAYHPLSSSHLLNKFFTGYYLKDYKVSETSKDYRKLMSKFRKMGLFDMKGHAMLIMIGIVTMMILTSVYGVLFSVNYWVHLLCGALLGFSWIQLSWMFHDTSHYQTMVSPTLNNFMQYLMINCLSGASVSWWKWSHNAHHIACNSLDYDPDMHNMPFLAISSKFFTSFTSHFYEKKINFGSLSRLFISYQHITFYPIFPFLRIFMYARSFYVVFAKRKVVNRHIELLGLLVFWTWFSLLVSCLPDWCERVTFLLVTLMVSGIQQFQFSLNHLSCEVYQGPPRGNDWFEKQTSGTLDIACSPWMDWFHGGLQFQIEHHLFPRMPRCHLRKIAPFVEELCKKHHFTYNSVSFWKANILTFRTVRDAALEARDQANTIPRNLIWEAMTTHG